MFFLPRFASLLCALSVALAIPALAATTPGSLDTTFTPTANNTVNTMTVQPDGHILVGGYFTAIGTTTRNHLARLTATGSLESAFNPNANDNVSYLAVQPDGKLLISDVFTALQPNGTATSTTRNHVARLTTADGESSNGALDLPFDPNANGIVRALALQPDGKYLIGGEFTMIGNVARPYLARLNADGSLDTGFAPVLNAYPNCLVLQLDGKILLGGQFTTVNDAFHPHLVRLNADGTTDTAFKAGADDAPFCMVVQPDGAILLGGVFNIVNTQTHHRLARLSADGVLDAAFNPSVDDTVFTMALQTDGKILIGGNLATVNTVTRGRVARVNPDGTLDTTFSANTNNWVYSVNLQDDGKVLLGGGFTTVGGTNKLRLARLFNDPATQSLNVLNTGHVQWLRGGSSPEAQQVTFELSTDNGATWTLLGLGTRVSGGWELAGLNLPPNGQITARARTLGGFFNGSSGLVETVKAYTGVLPGLQVANGAVTGITATGATLNATVYPAGLATHVVVYLDGAAVLSSDLPASRVPSAVAFPVGNLAPGSAHGYYLLASNAQDTVQGAPVGFTTLTPVLTATATAGPNGTVAPSPSQLVNYGTAATFTAAPASGYLVDQWLLNGAVAQTGGTAFAVANVKANLAVQVTFKLLTYPVTPTAGANGTISPAGIANVLPGSNVTYTATPTTGYAVDQWLVNGTVVQTGGNGFTLNNVTGTEAVSVTFRAVAPIVYVTSPPKARQPGNLGLYSADGAFVMDVAFRLDAGQIVSVDRLLVASRSGGLFQLTFDEKGHPLQLDTTDGTSLKFHLKPDGRVKIKGVTANGAPVKAFATGFASSLPAASADLLAVVAELQATDFSPGASSASARSRGFTTRALTVGQANAVAHFASSVAKVGVLAFEVALAVELVPEATVVGAIWLITKPVLDGLSIVADSYERAEPSKKYLVLGGALAVGIDVVKDHKKLSKALTAASSENFGTLAEVIVPLVGLVLDKAVEQYLQQHTLHTVTAIPGSHGSVTPDRVPDVPYHGTASFHATPENAQYKVYQWLVGEEVRQTGGNDFTLIDVRGNTEVRVTFVSKVATVTATAGPHGKLNPSGAVSVNTGDDQSFTATPDGGYAVSQWYVDGEVQPDTGNGFTLRAVTVDHLVQVVFKPTSGGRLTYVGIIPGQPATVISPYVGTVPAVVSGYVTLTITSAGNTSNYTLEVDWTLTSAVSSNSYHAVNQGGALPDPLNLTLSRPDVVPSGAITISLRKLGAGYLASLTLTSPWSFGVSLQDALNGIKATSGTAQTSHSPVTLR